MNITAPKVKQWLLPAVLILFILEIILAPFVVQATYSGRSESPAHELTYTVNRLTWDSATDIRPDGSAELSLFSSLYDESVVSANGDKVVAPGTGTAEYVRLKNDVSGPIRYIAVLYELKENPKLPVEAVLTGAGFTDTDTYLLPEGILRENVIRAVTGTVPAKQIQDFDIEWKWEYEVSDERDVIDTELGNAENLSDVTVGLFIVVEDTNNYSRDDDDDDGDDKPAEKMYIEIVDDEIPLAALDRDEITGAVLGDQYFSIPKTGDNDPSIGIYIGLMAISAVMLVLLLLDRRREKHAK